MSASWQLSDLHREVRPKRSTIYRAVAADSYELSSNGQAAGKGRTLEGHFAVFDRWTEIRSAAEGHFMERIQPGAFTKTLRERGDKVTVMFSHGQDPTIGLQVLGKVHSLREDSTGVAYVVDLFDSVPPLLLEGLQAGSYGASFRARMVKERFDPRPKRSLHNPEGLPESVLTELSLKEFGPCALPAYAETSAEIRSLTDSFEPRARIAASTRASAVAELKPYWQLQGDPPPSWQLIRPGKEEARAITR